MICNIYDTYGITCIFLFQQYHVLLADYYYIMWMSSMYIIQNP